MACLQRYGHVHGTHAGTSNNQTSKHSLYLSRHSDYTAHTYTHIHTLNCTTLYLLHFITVHDLAIPYITLEYVTLPYTTLHNLTMHYIAFHCIALRYNTVQYSTLHSIALHDIALRTYTPHTTLHPAQNTIP